MIISVFCVTDRVRILQPVVGDSLLTSVASKTNKYISFFFRKKKRIHSFKSEDIPVSTGVSSLLFKLQMREFLIPERPANLLP